MSILDSTAFLARACAQYSFRAINIVLIEPVRYSCLASFNYLFPINNSVVNHNRPQPELLEAETILIAPNEKAARYQLKESLLASSSIKVFRYLQGHEKLTHRLASYIEKELLKTTKPTIPDKITAFFDGINPPPCIGIVDDITNIWMVVRYFQFNNYPGDRSKMFKLFETVLNEIASDPEKAFAGSLMAPSPSNSPVSGFCTPRGPDSTRSLSSSRSHEYSAFAQPEQAPSGNTTGPIFPITCRVTWPGNHFRPPPILTMLGTSKRDITITPTHISIIGSNGNVVAKALSPSSRARRLAVAPASQSR